MSSKSLIGKLFEPAIRWAASRYQASVSRELRKYGLRYDDLYDPLLNMDVQVAIDRLPIEEQDARNQRLKRAMDLSLKKSYLEPEMQAIQKPMDFYLLENMKKVEAENMEKALLGTGKDYDRSIP